MLQATSASPATTSNRDRGASGPRVHARESSASSTGVYRFIVALALIHGILYLPLLVWPLFWTSSEAREGHVVQTILGTREWILPLRNGLIPSKPPLFHWISAALSQIFAAESEWIPRLTSLLCGTGVVIATAMLTVSTMPARSAFGERTSILGERGVALLCIACLTTTYGFMQMLGVSMVDMTFCLFSTLSLMFPLRSLAWELQGRESVEPFFSDLNKLLFWGFGSYAVLARGPLGLVLPGVVLLGCAAVTLGPKRAALIIFRPHWTWALPLLIAGPWYALAVDRGGMTFVERQIGFENVERFIGGEHVNSGPPWFYVPSFVRTAFPWSAAAVVAAVGFLQARWRRTPSRALDERARWAGRLGAIWFLSGAVFLSLSSGKRHSYLLPLFPGFAWSLTHYLAAVIESRYDTVRRWFLKPAWPLVVAFLALLMTVGIELADQAVPIRSVLFAATLGWLSQYRLPLELTLLSAVGLQLIALVCKPRFALGRAVLLWLGIAIIQGGAVYGGRALKGYWKGFDEMAVAVNAIVPPDEPLGVVRHLRDESFDVLLYYLKRPVQIVPPEWEFDSCNGSLLVGKEWYDGRRDRVPGMTERARFRPRLDWIIGDDSREMVLLECAPRSYVPEGFI